MFPYSISNFCQNYEKNYKMQGKPPQRNEIRPKSPEGEEESGKKGGVVKIQNELSSTLRVTLSGTKWSVRVSFPLSNYPWCKPYGIAFVAGRGSFDRCSAFRRL